MKKIANIISLLALTACSVTFYQEISVSKNLVPASITLLGPVTNGFAGIYFATNSNLTILSRFYVSRVTNMTNKDTKGQATIAHADSTDALIRINGSLAVSNSYRKALISDYNSNAVFNYNYYGIPYPADYYTYYAPCSDSLILPKGTNTLVFSMADSWFVTNSVTITVAYTN